MCIFCEKVNVIDRKTILYSNWFYVGGIYLLKLDISLE
jgi:hypothetical protein